MMLSKRLTTVSFKSPGRFLNENFSGSPAEGIKVSGTIGSSNGVNPVLPVGPTMPVVDIVTRLQRKNSRLSEYCDPA
jgi:hypothetical protein